MKGVVCICGEGDQAKECVISVKKGDSDAHYTTRRGGIKIEHVHVSFSLF